MQRIQAEEDLEVLRPELGTRPRVYYKNLHRITKCFVGGTVVDERRRRRGVRRGRRGGSHEGRAEIGRATTDLFGEFTIDRLEPEAAAISSRSPARRGASRQSSNSVTRAPISA